MPFSVFLTRLVTAGLQRLSCRMSDGFSKGIDLNLSGA